eukprot:4517311-Amphidinium_carterae.1
MAEGRQPRFYICSAGLKNIGAVHPPRSSCSRELEAFVRQRPRDRVHDHRHIDFSAKEVVHNVYAIKEHFARQEIVNIDVRDLYNQAHDRSLARHTGLHLDNIRALGNHKNLPGVLFEVVAAVAELVRDARLRRNLCIVFWCKSGRHRSVAVATYLAYHFRQHFRFEVDLLHLCKADWPSQCQECRGTCSLTGWCDNQRVGMFEHQWRRVLAR